MWLVRALTTVCIVPCLTRAARIVNILCSALRVLLIPKRDCPKQAIRIGIILAHHVMHRIEPNKDKDNGSEIEIGVVKKTSDKQTIKR